MIVLMFEFTSASALKQRFYLYPYDVTITDSDSENSNCPLQRALAPCFLSALSPLPHQTRASKRFCHRKSKPAKSADPKRGFWLSEKAASAALLWAAPAAGTGLLPANA
jgi:hypothetical protein